jgi:ATP-dependent DNA helicase RecQ
VEQKAHAMAASSRRPSTSRIPVESEYQNAVVRAVLLAAIALSDLNRGAISRRRLINHLRGSQLPRSTGSASPPPAYALLEGHIATWVEELVGRLVEEGYLEEAPGAGAFTGGLVVTALAREALATDAPFPGPLLPERSRLGAHPEREDELRRLRADLAREEGRAPYGIFPNAALAELAARRPRSVADLAEIPGLGEARVRKYGPRILEALGGGKRGKKRPRGPARR